MNFSMVAAEKVLEHTATTVHGLSGAEVKNRLATYGPNTLPAPPDKGLFKVLLAPFANPFAAFLLLAIFVSLLTDHYFDALVIGIIVLIDAIIEWSQHYSAGKVVEALNQSTRSSVLVRRDGQTLRIDTEVIVPGDVVLLEEGDTIPADGRLLSLASLEVNESALTGESLPIEKQVNHIASEVPIYEQTNMVFRGTSVTSGRAEYVVTATGGTTEFARIAKLSTDIEEKAPVQEKIDALVKQIAIGVAVLGGFTFLLGLARNYPVDEMLRFVLALSVSAIPEGLPIALTIILLISIKTMARYKAVVKKLPTVETLGMVTTIATDKTGTLTENKLALAEMYTPHSREELTHAMALSISGGDHSANPLNAAIQAAAGDAPEGYVEALALPFDQDLRLSAVVWEHGMGYEVYVIGAAEHLIERCRGTKRKTYVAKAAKMSEAGHKVIGFAKMKLTKLNKKFELSQVTDLDFIGLVALADPVRPEAKEAIAGAHGAGIKVMMLTGDHRLTTTTVAHQLRIVDAPTQVSSGEEMMEISDQQLPRFLAKLRALSRVLPEHKYRILKAIKGTEITAMTGDGVNDAPALVEADVGVAMGSGTDVAKTASDMILLDNNFATIIHAIRIGRTAFTNIRKMVFYLLATNLGEILTMIGSLLLGLPLPLTAAQILWVNLVTDGSAVIPLGLDPAEPNVMRQPPNSPDKPLLDTTLIVRLLLVASIMAISTLYIFARYLPQGLMMAQTMAFTNIVVIQWANALNARSETASIIEGLLRPNYLLYIGLFVAIALQIVIMTTKIGAGFNLAPLHLAELWVFVWPVTAIIASVELHKLVLRSSGHSKK